jgi:hypothetical protein
LRPFPSIVTFVARSCLCSFLVALLAAWPGQASEPALLGVQACTTRCQSQFTDCVLACDGALPCEQTCKVTVIRCVAECRR